MEKTIFYNLIPSKEEEVELNASNSEHQVTTTLVEIRSLYPPPIIRYQNPWIIKKRLIGPEVNMTKFFISFMDTFRHVLRYWNMGMAQAVTMNKRVSVILIDVTDANNPRRYQDRNVYFSMMHKEDYAVVCNQLFMYRNLKVGDEIRMFWDPISNVFQFKLFSRAV